MKPGQMKDNLSTHNFASTGGVTRDMVHARVVELALIDGRSVDSVTMSDFAQAKRDLTDELANL